MTMRILVVQNAPTSPIGLVGEVLKEDDVAYDLIQPYDGADLPETPDNYNGLVILGGPQNALADNTHPYLPALAKLTRAFGNADKAVAGICLGAQIIARAYDAKNILDRELEFGYHLVHPLEAARSDPVMSVFREPTAIFQWHSDTFTIPAGAIHLARSDMTAY
ncbi:MAG: type 1 glutamine amidotransferase, partial [Fimbriimonadaceae bacterium]|nr:type 1 glutamine amidotransferase [Alphaproteobacteria bacterium]